MAKIHFIAPEIQKRKRIKMRWKALCFILAAIVILENSYILYTTYIK